MKTDGYSFQNNSNNTQTQRTDINIAP